MSRPIYPDPPPGVFQITQSEQEEYLKCGLRREYALERKHRSSTVRMVVGSALSHAAAHENRHKLTHGIGVPLPEIVEAGVAGYEAEIQECEVSGSTLEIATGKDDAAGASRAYGERVSPIVEEVLAVQEPIVAEIRPGFQIAGTLDLIDPVGLGDDKTGRMWTQEMADKSRQLPFYGLLHLGRYGALPRRLWIDNVYRHKDGWRAQRIYTHRSPSDYRGIVEILERTRKGIEAGISLPPPEHGAWYCSHDYCPFFHRCSITQGGSKNGTQNRSGSF